MIKTLQLHNFKAFQDTGEIEIKPITVLAGPNSGGKSSILQSLLLLKQTLETEAPDIALNLNGRFLQFSRFDELTFGKPQLRYCEVIYRIRFETNIPTEAIAKYYPNLSTSEHIESLLVQSYIGFSFRYKEVGQGKKRVVLDRFDILSRIQDESGPRLTLNFYGKEYQAGLERIELPKPYEDMKTVKVATRHFLPSFLFLEAHPGKGGEYQYQMPLDQIFVNSLTGLEEELRNHLRYLGPLRQEPERVHLFPGSPSSEIGQRGEYTGDILLLEKDVKVQYLPSPDQEPEEFSLLDAVNHAFHSLGVIEPIRVRPERSIAYQILFGLTGSKSKRQVTIADVGSGVSQLLPIVLMGVRSERASLLLFEQPEIHLHPKLQANLADFFLRMTLLGKRIIVETHSDHFINRLRRRIAEDPTDQLRNRISILFVHPPHDGHGATIEPLRIDRYGIIENWPPDFLPESADEAEAILTAGLEKRKGG